MKLLVKTHWDLAKESVRQNRSRSFLTCLGIGIGVASIILLLSLMGSVQQIVAKQVQASGDNLIVVRPTSHKDVATSVVMDLTGANQYKKSVLNFEDVKKIRELEDIDKVSPITIDVMSLSASGMANGETITKTVDSATVAGISSDLYDIQGLQLKAGAFIENDSEKVAVIGRQLSLQLFGTMTEAVGKTFLINEERFVVIGLLKESEEPVNFSGIDFDNALLVNADYLEKLDPGNQVQQINVKVKATDNVQGTADKIKELLLSEKKGDNNFEVVYGNEIATSSSSLFNTVSILLAVVAGVSLIVGGIGVMNIMLVSVAERTREIGIRKAVGASGTHIMMQFLFEALILSVAGGVLGLIIGYILAFLVSVVTPFAPYIDLGILGIVLLTSVLIGIDFGLYPAIKAARKNPIESLRYYR